MRTQTADWVRLNAGDAVLLPHGAFHVMASSPDVPAVDIDTLARKPLSDNLYLMNGADGDGPPTQVMSAARCGSTSTRCIPC